MNLWQEYLRPTNLSQALQAFAEAPRPILPIAGGTDLLLDLEQGRHSPVHTLLDVTSIAEMNVLEARGDELFIGAAVPVNRVALHPFTVAHARALTEACNLIAGPQVRNVATLGGNVAHADPADRKRLLPLARQDWKPDVLAVGARAAYLWCPRGMMDSLLAATVTRLLGDGATTRNWATVTKLHALAGGPFKG